ncbi:MAG: lecithin retinol acyltransferase family protein [Gammaproteobacteria bacterium]|nr:lecithin retinol acyltransferase family protein [Gammaproteobacteria bacterium]
MNAEELVPGSRLIVRRRAYFHHGIYTGNGRVIHYAGWLRGTRGLVEEVTLDEFSRGHPYRIGRMPPDRRTGEDIVRHARSRLGERRYNLLRNNCEHFCNWCQLGECRSEQVEALVKPALLLVGIAHALGRELLAVCSVVAPSPKFHRDLTDPSRLLAAGTPRMRAW